MSEVFNSSVLDAINRAVQDGISTTALEVDGTPQYCIINAETREIEIPGELNIFGVESDEKSTRVYFRCPKYVGTNVDLDMTKCMVYVPYRNANGEKDQYIVTDLNETEDGENVEFTWLISRKASAYMGITEFGIRAIKTAVGGTIEAEWNTTVASANVIRGMDVGLLEFSEENKDAIAQAVDLVKQEIELKGQETIATIPSDYTTVAQNALSAKNEVEDIRVGVDGTTYESAGKAVREQISSLKGDLANKADKVELNDKIDKPSVVDDNKVPRAKNGDVEWVQIGQPTDEQTGNAVNNWLNDHPEATTTVQDQSIGVKKHENWFKNFSDLSSGGIYNGYSYERLLSSDEISVNVSENLIVNNVMFKSVNGTYMIFTSGKDKIVEFHNCIFDNAMLRFWGSATYKFKNCIFRNFTKTQFFVSGSVSILIDNCDFLDGIPVSSVYNDADLGFRIYGFNPISVMSNNNNVTVINSNFKNVMRVIFGSADATDCTLYFENNMIIDTFEGGVGFNKPVKGVIKGNTFENIGGTRGLYGLDIPSTNKGVGCCALYVLDSIELDVINNTIINVVENGIEGVYRNVIGNNVSNSGYRYSEGFTTPSTECYYVVASSFVNNVGKNPYNKNAFILLKLGDTFGTCVVSGNTAISDKKIDLPAMFFDKCTGGKVTISNNYSVNYSADYGSSNVKLQGYKFIGGSFHSLIEDRFKKCYYVGNPKQSALLLPDDENLKHSNGSIDIGVDENGVKYKHLLSSDIYGCIKGSIRTDYVHNLCFVRAVLKSDKDIKISLRSVNDNNAISPTDIFGVYGGQQISFEMNGDDYVEVTGLFPVYGTTVDITIHSPNEGQNLYVRSLEIQLFNN